MKSHKPPSKNGSPDDFQTPPEALKPLIWFLNKNWVIWECAEGKGNLSEELFKNGFSVIGSDKNNKNRFPAVNSLNIGDKSNYLRVFQKDFLKWKPDKFDCIITNPPFSLKQQFLERCYTLKKPFALLLPLTTFETSKRQELFKKYGLQVIFFDKRINFETPNGKKGKESSSWFATAWFTWGLNLPKELNFFKLD
jgi:hypothetical protein